MRKKLISLHLIFAAFFAPAFILLAISGGLYLLDNKGEVAKTTLIAPQGATLDFASPTLEKDVRQLLKSMGEKTNLEGVNIRNQTLRTSPTSRVNYQITQNGDVIEVERNNPNLQARMMELHKGHGPKLFILYQKLVAIGLIFIVLSGLYIGLTSPMLRKRTLTLSGTGLLAFILIALVL